MEKYTEGAKSTPPSRRSQTSWKGKAAPICGALWGNVHALSHDLLTRPYMGETLTNSIAQGSKVTQPGSEHKSVDPKLMPLSSNLTQPICPGADLQDRDWLSTRARRTQQHFVNVDCEGSAESQQTRYSLSLPPTKAQAEAANYAAGPRETLLLTDSRSIDGHPNRIMGQTYEGKKCWQH